MTVNLGSEGVKISKNSMQKFGFYTKLITL